MSTDTHIRAGLLYLSFIHRHYMIRQCATAVIKWAAVHRRVTNGGVNCCKLL